MVMRNRHEGSGTPHWWDDLPPHMRDRFTQPLVKDENGNEGAREARREQAAAPEPQPAFSRGEVLIDLSRFALVFIFISSVILLYMLVALSYVAH
jgi:hypothetical protein